MPRLPCLLLAAATLPLAVPAALAAAGPFDRLDVFELELAADPQISPDGRQIAYVRRSMDIMTDHARSNIWTVSADGRRHRPLLSGADSYSSPRWSPGGDRLAYVSAAEGRGPELYVRWLDTGQTAMLTNLREGPGDIAWAPDGTQIAFTMFVPAEGPTLATPPKAPEGAEWATPAKVIDRLYYRADGKGYLEVGNTHVFVVPAEGGTPRQLTSGDYDHEGPLSWSPDAQTIAFSANRSEDYEYQVRESDVWTVDVGDGSLRRLTDRKGPDGAPVYSPDGDTIAYLGFDDEAMGYHNIGVYLMDADGGNPRELTGDFDRAVERVAWSGRPGELYIQYDDRGRSVLATLTAAGDVKPVADDLGGTTLGRPYTSGGFSVAANGAYAYTAGTVHRPADVAAGRHGTAPTRLTALNDDLLAHRALGDVEELTWTSSADGLEIQGWLVTPPDFDSEADYPLILEIHGGPFAAYGPHFSAEVQLYAAAGYAVLYANPRGSTGYGYAFANEIHHAYPGRDYDDLMSGVDAIIERGWVDTDQLFVTGGSGGGVLTAWIVGRTDRFRAAVVAKPVINWISHVLTGDGGAVWTQLWFPTVPWEDPEGYWARSPLSLVGNVTTPTMLLTGERDYRTPIGESEQYYQALKLRKIDTAMVRIPEAAHGIAARPSQLVAKADNILAWFARYRD